MIIMASGEYPIQFITNSSEHRNKWKEREKYRESGLGEAQEERKRALKRDGAALEKTGFLSRESAIESSLRREI